MNVVGGAAKSSEWATSARFIAFIDILPAPGFIGISHTDLATGGKGMEKGALAHLAVEGAELTVRVVPRAGRNEVALTDEGLTVRTTSAPEGGKANASVAKLLSHALGVPKSRLVLARGQAARDKVFRIE